MLKKIKFSRTFFIVTGVAFGFLAISIGTLVAYKYAFIASSITNSLREADDESDRTYKELTSDIVTYQNTVFSEDFLTRFKLSVDKENYLTGYLNSRALSSSIAYSVSLVYENQFYSSTSDYVYITSTDLKKVDSEVKAYLLGRYLYRDNLYSTILGYKSSDVICLYYLNEDSFAVYLDKSNPNIQTFLTTLDGNAYISTTDRLEDFELSKNLKNESSKWIFVNGKRYYYLRVKSEFTSDLFNLDLYFGHFVDYYYVFLTIDLAIIVVSILAFGLALFTIITSLINIKMSVKPVKEISNEIRNLDLENIENENPVNTDIKEDVEILHNSYLDMVTRIQNLIAKQKLDSEIQRKLEYDALQMQINPHFLYNALDCAVWMARIYNIPELEEFIISLARFYRLSLHKGAKYIKVSEELDIVKYFLDIQKTRSDINLKYEINLANEVEDCLTLKLILQPFVENCTKYAFVGNSENNLITIDAYGEEDNIIFEIKDNGVGFDTEKLDKLQSSEAKNGFGIKNVRDRLNLEYKDKANVEIYSTPGKGTLIKISIPKTF